jgi:hypothetical protein
MGSCENGKVPSSFIEGEERPDLLATISFYEGVGFVGLFVITLYTVYTYL